MRGSYVGQLIYMVNIQSNTYIKAYDSIIDCISCHIKGNMLFYRGENKITIC